MKNHFVGYLAIFFNLVHILSVIAIYQSNRQIIYFFLSFLLFYIFFVHFIYKNTSRFKNG
jgi:hypothetical protein